MVTQKLSKITQLHFMHYFFDNCTACNVLSLITFTLHFPNLQYKYGAVCMWICAYVCVCLFLTAWSVDLDGLVAFQSVWALLTHTLLPTEGHPVSNWEWTPEKKHTQKISVKLCRCGIPEILLGSVHPNWQKAFFTSLWFHLLTPSGTVYISAGYIYSI